MANTKLSLSSKVDKTTKQSEVLIQLRCGTFSANRTRIWKLAEMDADHVTVWSKGGETDISNCQMLCKTHNRAKGNR